MSYLLNLLIFTLILVFSGYTIESVSAQNSILASPLKQFKTGISANDVKCNSGLLLVIKSSDGSPACVTPSTAQKLQERGWGVISLQSPNMGQPSPSVPPLNKMTPHCHLCRVLPSQADPQMQAMPLVFLSSQIFYKIPREMSFFHPTAFQMHFPWYMRDLVLAQEMRFNQYFI